MQKVLNSNNIDNQNRITETDDYIFLNNNNYILSLYTPINNIDNINKGDYDDILHTKSVLLYKKENSLILIDNLRFTLIISLNNTIQCDQFIFNIIESYSRYHFGYNSMNNDILIHNTLEKNDFINRRTKLIINSIDKKNRDDYNHFKNRNVNNNNNDDDDDYNESTENIINIIENRYYSNFIINIERIIPEKERKDLPNENQYKITFDNHTILSYFMYKFKYDVMVDNNVVKVKILHPFNDKLTIFKGTEEEYIKSHFDPTINKDFYQTIKFSNITPLNEGLLHPSYSNKDCIYTSNENTLENMYINKVCPTFNRNNNNNNNSQQPQQHTEKGKKETNYDLYDLMYTSIDNNNNKKAYTSTDCILGKILKPEDLIHSNDANITEDFVIPIKIVEPEEEDNNYKEIIMNETDKKIELTKEEIKNDLCYNRFYIDIGSINDNIFIVDYNKKINIHKITHIKYSIKEYDDSGDDKKKVKKNTTIVKKSIKVIKNQPLMNGFLQPGLNNDIFLVDYNNNINKGNDIGITRKTKEYSNKKVMKKNNVKTTKSQPLMNNFLKRINTDKEEGDNEKLIKKSKI